MKLSAAFVTFVAIVLALVSSATATSKVDNNSNRIARGLPPLRPRNLFGDRKHRALKPRASVLPPAQRATIMPGGACGCTYLLYSQTELDGICFPVLEGPYSTAEFDTLLECQRSCDNDSNCSYSTYSSNTCNYYFNTPDSDPTPAPPEWTGMAYDDAFQCFGQCFA